MSRFFYSLLLFFGFLLISPKILFDWTFRKKYRKSGYARLKRTGPAPKGAPCIWLHGVSVGEVKALATLVPLIRKTYPKSFILVSTVTETGQACAKKAVKGADEFVYMPLDFSSIIRPFVRSLSPDFLILIEGDYWPNLIKSVKDEGGKVAVASGRISEKSMKRYKIFKPLVEVFFSGIDLFGMQSAIDEERMKKMGIPASKLFVTGNLKFDSALPELSDQERKDFKERLGIAPGDQVVTIGSTHKGEEALLLQELKPILSKRSDVKILLVPRHPERFTEVEQELKKSGYTYGLYSRKETDAPILIIDQMGILMRCYQISDLAVVGGSFVPEVGGHNIFEPAIAQVPVFFGPFMENQLALVDLISNAGAGKQLDLEELGHCVAQILANDQKRKEMGLNGKQLESEVSGSAERTWKTIQSKIFEAALA